MRKLFTIIFLCSAFVFSVIAQNSAWTHGWNSEQQSKSSGSIESVSLVEGRLEIVRRFIGHSFMTPAIWCEPGCDWTVRRVWKEIYVVKNGQIVLESTIEGKIIPSSKEYYEWPKQ